MTKTEIKSRIKDFKASEELDAMQFIFPEVEGKNDMSKWHNLLRVKKVIKLTPAVGDVALYIKVYNGNAIGGGYIGVVSKVAKGSYSLLVEKREEKRVANFGATHGLVLKGFVDMTTEEIIIID